MQSVPFRDLQNIALSTLRRNLTSDSKLFLTVQNKPIAVIVSLDNENAQDIMLFVSRLRAKMAVHAIRRRARREALNKMPLRDANILIKKTRTQRKS